ncbi:ethanolamine ammonia-lyase subunit EutC [Pseudonocardia nigra]|uniref:ethanolamine ammonia-lyase subunit EutC n=1 Tax=Pseudonocardia nigra TaxID=1921578 RepID=UPI0027E2EB0A|nr:ethanolamine ammonia-lyase subunit EutC [Pseudonocardia nigra]
MTGTAPVPPDPWTALRRHTAARVGLGRAGDSLPTARLLEFEVAHAAARDAVHTPVDLASVRAQLGDHPTVTVRSAAPDRAAYLQRPDLGRRLDPECAGLLERGDHDVAFVIADGLSARAVHDHAAVVLREVLERLDGWRVAPVVLATQGRVALGDEIGERLGAALVVVLLGERPGLSAADSLGIYLTAHPRIGRRDSERNCISNVHPPDGLGHVAAAEKLVYLMAEARRLGLSGVELKDDAASIPAN